MSVAPSDEAPLVDDENPARGPEDRSGYLPMADAERTEGARLTPGGSSGGTSWRTAGLSVVALFLVGVLGFVAACKIQPTVTPAPRSSHAMRGHAHNVLVVGPSEMEASKERVVTDADEEEEEEHHHNGSNASNASKNATASNASASNESRHERHNETKAHHHVHKNPCPVEEWPDKDHGLVCGDCKVLVNQFSYIYETCDNYCSLQGRQCTGAWEERDDDCNVLHTLRCNESLFSSDAICECGTKVNKTLRSEFKEKVDNKRASMCGQAEEDMDFWSTDSLMTAPNVESMKKCIGLCETHPDCSAWTWGKKADDPFLSNVCFLKKMAWGEAIIKHHKEGVVSGHRYGPHCDRWEPSYYTAKPKNHTDGDSDEHGHHHHPHESEHEKSHDDDDDDDDDDDYDAWKHVGDKDAPTHGVIKNTHGFCLDAAEPHKNDGDIQMMTCTPGSRSQQWVYTRKTGQIKNKEGLCLATESRKDLSRLRTLDCDTTDWNQQWDYFAKTATIKNWRGPCLDAGERNLDGGMTYLRTCSEKNWNQRWEFGALENMTLEVGTMATRPMSLYCFALMLPGSYEQGLLAMQYKAKVSLFACEAYSIYSNKAIEVADGLVSGVVDSDLKCKKGGEFGTALNLDIFLAVWKKVIEDAVFRNHDWTAKVDPDAVFFPSRLRGIVAMHPETEKGVYLNNCKYGLHGPVEVFSRNAVVSWSEGSQHCKDHFWKLCHGDCMWGEDLFVDQCLYKVLDVRRENDYRVLMEDHCDPPSDWATCSDATRAAFHPFKKQDAYRACLDNATIAEELKRRQKRKQ